MATAPQVRAGRVSKVNYEDGTYEVVFTDRDSVSCVINAASNGEYKMPEVGQMVSCQMNGNGTVAGASLGTVWNQTNKPAEGYEGLYRKEYGRKQGDSYERYDANTGNYTQHTRNQAGRESGSIRDSCTGTHTIKAGAVSITGGSVAAGGKTVDIEATGAVSLTGDGGLNLESGGNGTVDVGGTLTITVGGVVITISGSDVTVDAANVTVNAANVTVQGGAGDVKVNGISLVHHKHKDAGQGEPEK